VIDPSHPDYVPLSVTNTLLGGFFSSRITTNIREDKGYTYSPKSSISSRYRDAYWTEKASVSIEVTGSALTEIFYEINRLQDEPPTIEELNGIQNYMAGVFVLKNSSLTGITNKLVFVDLHGLSEEYLTSYVKNVYAVTPADITHMMNTYLREGDMTIAIAGDVTKIKAQVEPFGQVLTD
jgi:predicted Zn-dependent peptidase